MAFHIMGLPSDRFAPLFDLTDADLAAQGGSRRTAKGGEQCRISLTDAKAGDDLILVNLEHLAVDSPYRMRFAVFVRRGEKHFDEIDFVPEQLRMRTLALRSFDVDGMLVAHTLVQGREIEGEIKCLFDNPAAAYIHAHYASAGCYAARIDRA